MFAKIDALRKEIASRRPLTPGELARLREEFTISFTYNSNAIEGNTLTLQETALVLEGITIDRKPLKDHLEAVGHRDAFLYVLDLVQKQEPLSERVIKEVHSLVLINQPYDKGVYRRVPVTIMGAVHEPVQPYLIPIRMEQLMAEYHDRTKSGHLVEQVAWFHLEFEAVHPFIDGNGRTGRMLVNLELMKAGYPPIDIKFIDRRRYYDCFTVYHQTGSPKAMTELLTAYLQQELERYLTILEMTGNVVE
jgi:Fic family protein